ncbi:helix-turn-helix domain-containing protein [Bradyrhizobium sp. 183]|uniref:helix-turn-helix domain-containing protein n=1 Tax=Bradyrhizobium sp. 184 TaxID=2782653 RepID=UPI0020553721|nr:helix-turn-helix domain-containing protein [Bradyrhizobium sp. 188]UPJ80763.1 helix-turn-helix domain-containing protein [Bradyrhizobium sp. 184]UPJ88556.1 helix-turn-helix domain-containing protein [Bradyrhizobium sp. 183]
MRQTVAGQSLLAAGQLLTAARGQHFVRQSLWRQELSPQLQSRYMALSYLVAADERISRAERWARSRLDRTFSISELATAVGLGARTFARRCERATGLSPVKFVQKLRVDKAMELLDTTRLGLDEIAERVGYADPSTLRKLLHRERTTGARAWASQPRE